MSAKRTSLERKYLNLFPRARRSELADATDSQLLSDIRRREQELAETS